MLKTRLIPPDEVSHLRPRARTRFREIVIGAGQAGLAVGRHLVEAGVDVLVLDAAARIGDVWRRRWDSLRLFIVAEVAGLTGFPFPATPTRSRPRTKRPTTLEDYARRFRVPVRPGTRVDALDGLAVASA